MAPNEEEDAIAFIGYLIASSCIQIRKRKGLQVLINIVLKGTLLISVYFLYKDSVSFGNYLNYNF